MWLQVLEVCQFIPKFLAGANAFNALVVAYEKSILDPAACIAKI